MPLQAPTIASKVPLLYCTAIPKRQVEKKSLSWQSYSEAIPLLTPKCSVSCVFITYSGSGKWMIDTINHSHPRRLKASLTSSRASITKVPKPRKSVLLYLCSVPCVSRQNINVPRQWWATLWPSDLMSHASRLTTYRVSLHQSPRIKDIWTICQDVSTHD